MERDEDRFAALVHIHHAIQQGIDDEMRPVVLHAVELGAVCLDTIEHAVFYPGDTFLELFDPAQRKCPATAGAGHEHAVRHPSA